MTTVSKVVFGRSSGDRLQVGGEKTFPAKPIIYGLKVVWGLKPRQPVTGLPEGRSWLRLSPNEAGKVFVQQDWVLRCYLLEDCGTEWKAVLIWEVIETTKHERNC